MCILRATSCATLYLLWNHVLIIYKYIIYIHIYIYIYIRHIQFPSHLLLATQGRVLVDCASSSGADALPRMLFTQCANCFPGEAMACNIVCNLKLPTSSSIALKVKVMRCSSAALITRLFFFILPSLTCTPCGTAVRPYSVVLCSSSLA